jgi:hypothetical protein
VSSNVEAGVGESREEIRESSPGTVRALGLICMAYSLVHAGVGIAEIFHPTVDPNRLVLAWLVEPSDWRLNELLLALPGFLAGIVGYVGSGAAGRGRLLYLPLAYAWIGSGLMLLRVGLRFDMLDLGVPLAQWFAPITLGVAALVAKRVRPEVWIWPIWIGIAPLFFPFLHQFFFSGWPKAIGWTLNGINWFVFGALVFALGRGWGRTAPAAAAPDAPPAQPW